MADKYAQMDAQALSSKAGELKKELFELRMQASTMQVKDYSKFRKVRKEVARVLTALSALGQN